MTARLLLSSSQGRSDPQRRAEAAGGEMAGDAQQLGQVDGQKTQEGPIYEPVMTLLSFIPVDFGAFQTAFVAKKCIN